MSGDWRGLPQSDPANPLYRAFLERGARRHGTDKWHHYFDVYERHFSPFRGRDIRLLEIGVQRGGSLDLWRGYFGAGSRMSGIDIDPACAALTDDGIAIHIGDQADADFLRGVVARDGPFDIVIDDGGHRMNQMITSFETLYPAMTIPGVYVVEDTHTCAWGGPFADRADGETFLARAQRLAAALNEWTGNPAQFQRFGTPPRMRDGEAPASAFCRTTHAICFYDSMVVFERRQRPEPWRQVR